jgi:hypothetical protein
MACIAANCIPEVVSDLSYDFKKMLESCLQVLLVLLVNDSEDSKSTGTKRIFKSLLAVFISFPWRAVRPHPTPPPLFGGGKVPKKTKKKENRTRGRGGCGAVQCRHHTSEVRVEKKS